MTRRAELPGLAGLAARCEKLTIAPIAEAAGEELLTLVDERFQSDTDPAGKRWPRRQDTEVHPLLERTGALRKGFEAAVDASGAVTLTNTQDYANAAQAGRRVVPEGRMPTSWRERLDKVTAAALQEELKP